MSESPAWDVVVKIAVAAPDEAQARSIVGMLLGRMGVSSHSEPPFVQFEDGAWATEIQVHDPAFEQVEPADPLSVLSCLTADLETVTWLNATDTPFDPESADVGRMEWPPGYWALAGRKEVLGHPLVRAVSLQARRVRATSPPPAPG